MFEFIDQIPLPTTVTYVILLTVIYCALALGLILLGRAIPKPSIDTIAKPVDVIIIPSLNLITAFFVAALVIAIIGKNSFEAIYYLFLGAFGSLNSIGLTLFHTTNYIFAGLAVAIAFQAKLFNIGGEGQATMGGVGATAVVLIFDRYLPGIALIPLAVIAAMLTGGLWGFIAGWMQAYRNAHIVITTIMLNWIGSSVLIYLLANFMQVEGGAPETRVFEATAHIPSLKNSIYAPVNLSFFLALFLCFAYWYYVWRTKWGYELRAIGQNEHAAEYAGVKYKRQILIAMTLSGAFAGLVAINIILGETHSLKTNFVNGAGFVGIAVALMGRNHPIGIIFAALLFGAMQQGGFELRFYVSGISNYVVMMLMGLVIYFSGALANQFMPIFMNSKKIAIKSNNQESANV